MCKKNQADSEQSCLKIEIFKDFVKPSLTSYNVNRKYDIAKISRQNLYLTIIARLYIYGCCNSNYWNSSEHSENQSELEATRISFRKNEKLIYNIRPVISLKENTFTYEKQLTVTVTNWRSLDWKRMKNFSLYSML